MTSSSARNADLDLKLLTSRIFRGLGYVTWVEVDYFAHSYDTRYARPGVTDLDVLGVAYDGDLGLRMIGAECRSPDIGAAEELLKLIGVLKLFGANRGYLVKERIADNAREIAAQHSIGCLDHQEALALLGSLEADVDAKLAAERRGYESWMAVAGTVKEEKSVVAALRYVRKDFWTREHWENVHNLLFLSQHKLIPYLNPSRPEHKAWALEFCRLFNLSLLGLCHSVLSGHLGNLDREIEVQAFGGPRSRRERERLFDEVAMALPKKSQLGNPLKPTYLPRLKEVVGYYLMSPLAASKTPAVLHRALFETYLSTGDMFIGDLPKELPEVAIKLAKDSSELLFDDASGKGKEFLAQLLAL